MLRWFKRIFFRQPPRSGEDVCNELDSLSCDMTDKSVYLMSWDDWRLYWEYLRESTDATVMPPTRFCGRPIRKSLGVGMRPQITNARAKDDRTFQSFHPSQSFRWAMSAVKETHDA